jgi:hypothetical protein
LKIRCARAVVAQLGAGSAECRGVQDTKWMADPGGVAVGFASPWDCLHGQGPQEAPGINWCSCSYSCLVCASVTSRAPSSPPSMAAKPASSASSSPTVRSRGLPPAADCPGRGGDAAFDEFRDLARIRNSSFLTRATPGGRALSTACWLTAQGSSLPVGYRLLAGPPRRLPVST